MIEQALEHLASLHESIENALTNDLGNVTMVFPDFASKLHQNIRFGCFGDVIAIPPKYNYLQAYDFIIDLEYFTMIEDKLSLLTGLRMFGKNVPPEIRNRQMKIRMEFDDYGVLTVQSSSIKPEYPRFKVIPILPPPYIVFDEDEEYLNVPEWKWEYISEYENWTQKIYDADLKSGHRHRSFYQIGGWGDFRQGSYNDEYIAQANTQHGDNGAVYVITHEQSHFKVFDQMC